MNWPNWHRVIISRRAGNNSLQPLVLHFSVTYYYFLLIYTPSQVQSTNSFCSIWRDTYHEIIFWCKTIYFILCIHMERAVKVCGHILLMRPLAYTTSHSWQREKRRAVGSVGSGLGARPIGWHLWPFSGLPQIYVNVQGLPNILSFVSAR